MPIQFRCARCNEPLEVDDDLAEKMVRCPYCEAVVTVPASSTLQLEEVVTARAAVNPPPPPPVGSVPPSPTMSAARPTAAPFGNAALGSTGMVVICFIAAVVYGVITTASSGALASQPTNMQEMREHLRSQIEHAEYDGFSTAVGCGMIFFMLAGLGFGITGLVRREPGPWRGWTSVAVCGLGMACQVLGAIAMAALMG